MLIVLAVCMVIASVVIACAKKNKESFFLMGLCLSLMLEICGVMLFIAKKGGISTEVMHFFYFSKEVKNRIQYMMITLNQMGYLEALGRVLFPFFLNFFCRCCFVLFFRKPRCCLRQALTDPFPDEAALLQRKRR